VDTVCGEKQQEECQMQRVCDGEGFCKEPGGCRGFALRTPALYVCSHSDSISSLLIVAVNITGDLCGMDNFPECKIPSVCSSGVCEAFGRCRVIYICVWMSLLSYTRLCVRETRAEVPRRVPRSIPATRLTLHIR
jgi:hypothetical protein